VRCNQPCGELVNPYSSTSAPLPERPPAGDASQSVTAANTPPAPAPSVSLPVIQQRLGQDSITTMVDTYGGLLLQAHGVADAAIDAALAGLSVPAPRPTAPARVSTALDGAGRRWTAPSSTAVWRTPNSQNATCTCARMKTRLTCAPTRGDDVALRSGPRSVKAGSSLSAMIWRRCS